MKTSLEMWKTRDFINKKREKTERTIEKKIRIKEKIGRQKQANK